MIKDIIKDREFLSQKSRKAVKTEIDQIVKDLIDTAEFHKKKCIGLAAIQIGYPVKIMVVFNGEKFIPFINLLIVKKSTSYYTTEESCLSVDEPSFMATRHTWVAFMHETKNGKIIKNTFKNVPAQIVQHEYDHFNGITIPEQPPITSLPCKGEE